jgi:hypothetical protein
MLNSKGTKMLRVFNRFTVYVLVCCAICLGLSIPVGASVARIDQLAVEAEQNRVMHFLERDGVRARLESQGVDAEIAKARVDALTDDELKMVAGHIDQVPTGSSDILGILLAVLVVLVITDILGLTKIFPFTRTIR